jgi:hypothetical protein
MDGMSWRRAPAPVRQLFWEVKRAVMRPKRQALSFGYDLKSYSQNFDDGLATAQRLQLCSNICLSSSSFHVHLMV